MLRNWPENWNNAEENIFYWYCSPQKYITHVKSIIKYTFGKTKKEPSFMISRIEISLNYASI